MLLVGHCIYEGTLHMLTDWDIRDIVGTKSEGPELKIRPVRNRYIISMLHIV